MSFDRNTPPLTADEQAVLALIQNHRALIKVISDKKYSEEAGKEVIDYTHIDFILDQIIDPTQHRPSRSAYFYSHEDKERPPLLKKLNLKTLKIHLHKPGECRTTKHQGVEYQHTTKTSTSLMPPEPQYMEVFDDDCIGLLWDIEACNLKNGKYVFEGNAGTNSCFWLCETDKDFDTDSFDLASSLEKIKNNNDEAVKQKKLVGWSEIVAGLPKGIVSAFFAPRDERDIRLRAWNVMLHAKDKLKCEEDLPVLVIQSLFINDHSDPDDHRPDREGIFRVYTAAEREKDLQELHALSFSLPISVATKGLFARTDKTPAQPVTDYQASLLTGFVGF